MSTSPYIVEIDNASFQQNVIEKSKDVPVLVDFWADWCNPCRILMPVLAKLAEEYQGQFILAKVDTEANREIAEREAIRSLPTIRMYKFGQVVDEFNGALPEPQVRQFIEQHLLKQTDTLFQQALQALSQGDTAKAIEQLSNILQSDPQHLGAIIARAKIHMSMKQYNDAEQLLNKLSPASLDEDAVRELQAQLTFAKVVANAADISSLQQNIEQNPKDIEAWYQLGSQQVMSNNYEAALEAFLNVMKIDRKYNDDAGRKAILQVFSMLGESGPLVNRYRAKMASALH